MKTRMKSPKPHPIHAKENPLCKEKSLPPSLIHDLMQPLNAFGLASEYLKESIQIDFGYNIEQEEGWKLMAKAIQTQERLLRKLRQLWQLSATPPPPIQAIELSSIGENIRKNHNLEFPNIPLKINGFQNDLMVISNAELLLNILNNLVDNAATHGETDVCISAKAIGKSICFEVSDSGRGLADGMLEELGMPFVDSAYRANSAQKGLGLGLYIATKNAETLNHKIEVTSSPGLGCKFIITAKRAVFSVEHAPAPNNKKHIAPPTILIVNEERPEACALKEILSSFNFSVSILTPTNQLDSLYSLGNNNDLVLINYETWSIHVKSDYFSPHQKIIVTTKGTREFDIITSQSRERNKLYPLPLPLTPSRLRAFIDNVLRDGKS